MTTALTLYGSNIAATTLANSRKLSNTTGGTETTVATTAPTDTNNNEYIQSLSRGGTATGLASLPASPSGNDDYIFDVTTLEGQTIPAGTWTVIDNFANSSSTQVLTSIVYRIWKRSSGDVYTSIGNIIVGSTTSTGAKQQITGNNSLASVSFATGDKIVVEKYYQGGTLGGGNSWSGQVLTQYVSNSGTAGVANDFQIATPGFAPTGGSTKLRISDGYGGLFQ